MVSYVENRLFYRCEQITAFKADIQMTGRQQNTARHMEEITKAKRDIRKNDRNTIL